MKRRAHVHACLIACLLATSACTQALLGDEEYVHGDDVSPSGAGPSSGGSISTSGAGGGGGGGGSTACAGGLTACDDACVELDSDSNNCGSCGHECAGSTCEAGLCTAAALVSGLADPRALALDDSHVYWATAGGTIERISKAGGAIETITETQDSPGTLVVDTTHVFWIDDATGAVMRQKKNGKGNPKLLSVGTGARGLAQDDASIYFSRKIKKGDIRVVQKMGGGNVTLAEGQPSPTELAVRGEYLFWSGFAAAEEGDDDGEGGSGADSDLPGGYVRRLPRLGRGTATTLATGEGEISDLAVIGETAIWVDRTNQQIRASGPADLSPVTLVADQNVRSLATDGVAIYWSTVGGNLKKRTLSGPVRLVAVDLPEVGVVRVDETHVYVLRTGPAGAVLRVAK